MLDWRVYSVFDPDGGGADFAYTDGLWPRIPELFVWARPVDGDDPGHDWALSPADRGVLLNEVAQACLDGTRQAGSRWSERYDAGMTVVHYTLCPPVDAGSTEAHQLDADTPVMQLRFSIERSVGALPPPGARHHRLARRAAQQIARSTTTRTALFGRSEPVGGAPFDATGPFRPVLVELQAALVDTRMIGPLTGAIVARGAIDAALGVVQAAARHSDRAELVRAVTDVAAHDAEVLAGRDGDARLDRRWRIALSTHLHAVLAAAYGTVVVADVLDAQWRANGCGWAWSLADPDGAARRFRRRVEAAGGPVSDVELRRWRRATRDEIHAAMVQAATDGHGADLGLTGPAAAAALARLGCPPGR